jgi:hypothetical protein
MKLFQGEYEIDAVNKSLTGQNKGTVQAIETGEVNKSKGEKQINQMTCHAKIVAEMKYETVPRTAKNVTNVRRCVVHTQSKV